MDVDEVGTQRFDVALELLREGETLAFDRVSFWLGEPGDLRVSVYTSWEQGNITNDKALADLDRAKSVLGYLINESSDFARLVEERIPRFCLDYDAGTSTVELANLVNDELVWAKGTDGFRKN